MLAMKISPQAAISTPGPAPFYDRSNMTEREAKQAFARLSVNELKRKFGLSRSSVYYWKQQWGMTQGSTGMTPAQLRELARTKRKKKAAEAESEHAELMRARAELLQLRAQNEVLQKLLRDLTLEVARLGGGKKRS